ncbi:hypothetical protein CJ030_MR6G020519 [Morella rubra]|uniref:Uncharacterized protein n=1 Tax=Morella rubra TaxID=262757 RepID=A0A6A1V9L8_9ROSI|nr:hypothetical protein CJ030_MR6G020519 [Morella rubra]
MSKRARTSSQADDEQSSARTLTVEQHTTIIMSRSIVVERDIKLADFNDLTFEGQTLPEVVEGLGILYGTRAAASFLGIMHLILCSSIDPKKHTTELSYSRAEFLYLAVVRGLPVDIASYIYLSIRAEALKTDATISLPHGILLTQFLHAMMVPESGDEPRALPLGSINKTTLSKSIAQTRRALQAARVARVRRQEQPEEAMEGEDPGQSSTQGLGAQRPSWMDSMMTELSQRMESVLQPTHCMVSDISRRLTLWSRRSPTWTLGGRRRSLRLKRF